VEDGAERPDGVARWGSGGRPAWRVLGVRLAGVLLRVAWRARCPFVARRPRSPSVGRRPRSRAPLSAPCRWSRLGNEGEDPGACCALSRAPCRGARVFRNTLRGDGANWVGSGPVSDPNPTQFANCAGSASVSAANPAQFANCPGSLAVSERNPGRFASRARTRPPEPPGHPPSLPKRDHKAERRAVPGGADASSSAARTPSSPAARTPSSPAARTRAARRRGRSRRPGSADTDRPRRRAHQACPVSPTRSRRTPPDRAVAASRPRRARRAGGTSRLSTTGARRRRSSPCRRSGPPRGRRRR
jgi:hypothetical protein